MLPIRLRALAVVPPIVVPVAPERETPSSAPAFGSAVPTRFVPRKLPSIVLPVAPEPVTWIALPCPPAR